MGMRLRTLASVHVTPAATGGGSHYRRFIASLTRSAICSDAPRAFRRLLIEIIAVR
jgi:hypothetical protein